jgi:hypothetical protein
MNKQDDFTTTHHTFVSEIDELTSLIKAIDTDVTGGARVEQIVSCT